MQLSITDLQQIGNRGKNLAEQITDESISPLGRRLDDARRSSADPAHPPAKEELNRYINAVRHRNPKATDPSHHSGPPAWTSRLNRIVEHIATYFVRATIGTTYPDRRGSTVPYGQLFWPIADFAWNEVVSAEPSCEALIGNRARKGLQKYLVRRVANIVSAAIHPAFLAHKSLAQSGMMQHFFATAGAASPTDDPAKEYKKFILGSGEEGLRSFFKSYPVAARLVSQVVRLWIDFVREFLRRFQIDLHELAIQFNNGDSLGKVASIEAGISDPHQDGRSVLILNFQAGLRLVYKPRPMEVDQAFFGLIAEINQSGPSFNHRALKIFARDEYGWMEFAASTACRDLRGARRYFHRAGALACLAYWLQGIDFHRENVVAAGEDPVLIDLESLAHPWRADEIAHPELEHTRSLAVSALRTGLLPLWQKRFTDSRPYDNCGFNGPVRQRSLFPSVRWMALNSDALHWESSHRYEHHAAHRPVLAGRSLPIGKFERDVLAGYSAMADLLTGPKAAKMHTWRERICASRRRKIKRPTLLYGMMIKQSLEPVMLRSGVDRSLSLLKLPCEPNDEQDWIEEISRLEMLDIPYFRTGDASTEVAEQAVYTPTRNELLEQRAVIRSAVRYELALNKGEICDLAAFRAAEQAPPLTAEL